MNTIPHFLQPQQILSIQLCSFTRLRTFRYSSAQKPLSCIRYNLLHLTEEIAESRSL